MYIVSESIFLNKKKLFPENKRTHILAFKQNTLCRVILYVNESWPRVMFILCAIIQFRILAVNCSFFSNFYGNKFAFKSSIINMNDDLCDNFRHVIYKMNKIFRTFLLPKALVESHHFKLQIFIRFAMSICISIKRLTQKTWRQCVETFRIYPPK